MFPEIIIGPILMAVGVTVIVCSRVTVELIHRGLTRMYSEPTADMLASGRRAAVGIAGAGCFFIGLGLITIYDAVGGARFSLPLG